MVKHCIHFAFALAALATKLLHLGLTQLASVAVACVTRLVTMARTTGHIAPDNVLSSVLVDGGPRSAVAAISNDWRPSPHGAVLVAGDANLDFVSDDGSLPDDVEDGINCHWCGDELWPILICRCPRNDNTCTPSTVCS